jgi:hypothetical protein
MVVLNYGEMVLEELLFDVLIWHRVIIQWLYFGAFSFPVHPISLPRILGVFMGAAGLS